MIRGRRAGRLASVNRLRRLVSLAARTVRALHPGWARPDDAWAEVLLDAGERAAYREMDPRERDHGVRVARRLLAGRPAAASSLVRAALLHDVGKAGRRYRVAERVLVHLWCPAPDVPGPFPEAWRAAWRAHREHAAAGAARLRAAGVDERVADLVARHHDPAPADDDLRALQAADEGA